MRANSDYLSEVKQAINKSRKDLIDLTIERKKSNPPTQASSEFLTNKKQGDWAEKTFIKAFNSCSMHYVAVKYGLDNELVSGEDGFIDFYERYQKELDVIGKKPDVLIIPKENYSPSWDYNISGFEEEKQDEIVSTALCGIEIRSSSFLHNNYEKYSEAKNIQLKRQILLIKEEIIASYADILQKRNNELFNMIHKLNNNNLFINYRTPTWKKTDEEKKLSLLLKCLNNAYKELQKRDFLSITPKVEDLQVVYNWIKKYNKPHYYLQVFFDSAFGINYLDILKIISEDSIDDSDYSVERDIKNQNKTTIKISTRKCTKVMENIELPKHFSECKQIGVRGRLLFYVNFEPSEGKIIKDNISQLLGVNEL